MILFRHDNPVMMLLGKAVDAVILSLLWLVCSLPIVTMGAATAAMYYAVSKFLRDEYGGVSSMFFGAFASNFKQATKMWLGFLLALAIIGCDLYFYKNFFDPGSTGREIALVVGMVALAVWLAMFSFTFSLQAGFENTVKQTLRNAVSFLILNLPASLATVAIDVAAAYISLFYVPFVGIPFSFCAKAWLLWNVFDKYMRTTEAEETV